jgi:arginyl-tRNA synthetase
MGAVRFALLKSSPGNDVVFDFEKSVSFEGDSGPYLQYTYARCKSVLRKAGNQYKGDSIKYKGEQDTNNLNLEELSVLRTLSRFDETVFEAARTFSPNLICGYLFDLAQKYNLFYNKHSILGSDNSQQITDYKKQKKEKSEPPTTNHQPPTTILRLALTETVSIVIKHGLSLLGIKTVERM